MFLLEVKPELGILTASRSKANKVILTGHNNLERQKFTVIMEESPISAESMSMEMKHLKYRTKGTKHIGWHTWG